MTFQRFLRLTLVLIAPLAAAGWALAHFTQPYPDGVQLACSPDKIWCTQINAVNNDAETLEILGSHASWFEVWLSYAGPGRSD